MKLISGNSNRKLALSIAKYLDMDLIKADVKRFSDKEIWVEINENVRGEDCFIIQSTSYPTNDNLMELLVLIDAVRLASAGRITAVIPYFGYARQDRKSGPRTPITAKLVARMLETAGVDRVLTMDLHATQIQGFFYVPVDNLFALPVLVRDIKKNYINYENIVFVSPDTGGVARTREFAKHFEAELAIIDKRRPKAGVAEVMNIVGDIKDKDCIIVDDIVDSAGTLANAADKLMESGAKSVVAYVSHGVLSGEALRKIENSELKEVVITDSIYKDENFFLNTKIRDVSINSLLGEGIIRTSTEKSVSELFDL